MKKLKTGEETPYKDRDGKAIKVHSYVADAAAVPLEELVNDKELGVRLLSAAEVGKLETERSATTRETPAAKQARIDKKNDAAAVRATKDAAAGKEEEEISKEDVEKELHLLMQMIPDELLADELKRRGYILQGIKINIKRI